MCMCSLQFKKKPEKKIAPTTNSPPATMPTHASAWFSRLGPVGGVVPGSSVGSAMVNLLCWNDDGHATPPWVGWGALGWAQFTRHPGWHAPLEGDADV